MDEPKISQEMNAESAADRVIAKAETKALAMVKEWRAEVERNGWDYDAFLRARAPLVVRACLAEAMIESRYVPETLGGISALLENGENRILAKILNTHKPTEWHLTVGALRHILADLPDCMPVFYERIEDAYFDRYGWRTTDITGPDPIHGELTCVEAFTAYVGTDAEGGKVLALTAHY